MNCPTGHELQNKVLHDCNISTMHATRAIHERVAFISRAFGAFHGVANALKKASKGRFP
jgi:hypothetical protein